MVVVLLFLVCAAAVAGWWLAQQGLLAKPWLQQGYVASDRAHGPAPWTSAKTALLLFMGVVGSLFALMISAYTMRMQAADWRPLPVPAMLWVNTGQLILGGLVLRWTHGAARRGDRDGVKAGLAAACVTAAAFLIGQLLVWRQLSAAGHRFTINPASSFFYLLLATHALHLAGGLFVLGRTTLRAWRRRLTVGLEESTGLLAAYFNLLLALWLIIMGLLTGWAQSFAVFCQRVLS
ncbi:cytochrome c oxidase subunit 3 [Alsobacter sp. KACC 23698]|uniref:Cytochrome c oxidase subunit 3 n=1 Tax=Alsobacter sp. KACC 23698 TaxID=3149229 RepID=A0AAU7JIZ8_9HYPH